MRDLSARPFCSCEVRPGNPVVIIRRVQVHGRFRPELIANDNREMRAGPSLSEYAVGTLGYPASSSDTLSITEVANTLEADLIDSGVFDNYSQIFFICHSLGGLVIKEVFHSLKIEHDKDSEKVVAIFLISTPSQGAPAANFIKLLPSVISGRLVLDIQTIDNNTYLRSLESKWHTKD
jgi:hypothetical protein